LKRVPHCNKLLSPRSKFIIQTGTVCIFSVDKNLKCLPFNVAKLFLVCCSNKFFFLIIPWSSVA
jgi:hypothetical protein